MMPDYLDWWLSRCGPWTISIIWEFIRKKILGPHLRHTELEILEVGPSNLSFNKPSRQF